MAEYDEWLQRKHPKTWALSQEVIARVEARERVNGAINFEREEKPKKSPQPNKWGEYNEAEGAGNDHGR